MQRYSSMQIQSAAERTCKADFRERQAHHLQATINEEVGSRLLFAQDAERQSAIAN